MPKPIATLSHTHGQTAKPACRVQGGQDGVERAQGSHPAACRTRRSPDVGVVFPVHKPSLYSSPLRRNPYMTLASIQTEVYPRIMSLDYKPPNYKRDEVGGYSVS